MGRAKRLELSRQATTPNAAVEDLGRKEIARFGYPTTHPDDAVNSPFGSFGN
jgi:hypothetical protein